MLVGGHTFLALGNPPNFIFPKGCNFFPADCSFKVSERPSKLLRRCPHSHCYVRVVNDYFVSCPNSQWQCRRCSQRLRGHATFKKYQSNFFYLYNFYFFIFQKWNNLLSQHSQQLRRHWDYMAPCPCSQHGNDKVRKIVFACYIIWNTIIILSPNNGWQSCDTVSLSFTYNPRQNFNISIK